MRAADGSWDTRGLQEKAPRWGMRYLVNITNKFHVAARSTSSPTRTRTLWSKDAQRKEGTTRTHLACILHYATADGRGGQSPGNRRRSTEHDHMHAWYIRWKKSSSTTKRPCSYSPMFLVSCVADNNKSRVYTLKTWWCCWRPKDNLIACMRAKMSRSRWTLYLARERVCQNDQKLGFLRIEKTSIVILIDVVLLIQLSCDVHGG